MAAVNGKKAEMVPQSITLTFYHVGKIVCPMTKGDSRNLDKQKKAVVEMWDTNLVICMAGKSNVRSGDFVLVSFDGIVQPAGNVLMHPKEITDHLSREDGEEVWQRYKELYEKIKPSHPLTG
jgi:hypothetical protein